MGYGPRLPKRVQFVRPVLLLPGHPVQEIHPGAPEGFRDIPPQTQMQLEHQLLLQLVMLQLVVLQVLLLYLRILLRLFIIYYQ